jgi:hypothetical protein
MNAELSAQDVVGEICVYGRAAMCLAFKARPTTKDVHAIFAPVKVIRGSISRIAVKHGLSQDWLNLAVKMFVVDHPKEILFDLSHLKVYVPTPDYLLAMKGLALRTESFDLEDTRFFDRPFAIGKYRKRKKNSGRLLSG